MCFRKRFCSGSGLQSNLRSALLLLALCVYACSCTKQPSDSPVVILDSAVRSGTYILCEGLWRQDNSTLLRFDATTGVVTKDVFALINPGLRLGDTGNDMVLKGDTLYIAVSTSKTIEILRASTGKWLGRIRLAGVLQEPRCITIVSDSVGFVTNLNDDSVTEFNPTTFTVRTGRIPVGPAPEGIASTARYVFVANSGYGDYRAKEPKAGTISVLDVRTHEEIRLLKGVPNILRLCVSADKRRLYAAYQHLLSQKDSLGGIVEYDAETLQELRRWRMKRPGSPHLSGAGDTLVFLSDARLLTIMLRDADAMPRVVVSNPTAQASVPDVWYGLGIHPVTGQLWVANVRNYTVNGEVIVFTPDGKLVRRFDVGLNPNSFAFF